MGATRGIFENKPSNCGQCWRMRFQPGAEPRNFTPAAAGSGALADRVIVIRDGGVALDIPIDLPRPRREAADTSAVALQARILDEV